MVMRLAERLEKLELVTMTGGSPTLYFLERIRDDTGVAGVKVVDMVTPRLPGESIGALEQRACAPLEPGAVVVSWVCPGEVDIGEPV